MIIELRRMTGSVPTNVQKDILSFCVISGYSNKGDNSYRLSESHMSGVEKQNKDRLCSETTYEPQ